MDTPPDGKSDRSEKSYLSAAVGSISPWGGSRASTPKPAASASTGAGGGSGLKNQHGGDATTHHWYGIRLKDYPVDCPSQNARWFYAVDVPKRKPKLLSSAAEDAKPSPPPKKFVAFSGHDSRAIESAYQKLADDHHNGKVNYDQEGVEDSGGVHSSKQATSATNTSQEEHRDVRVPVHEDFLFDVDIEKRELAPVYWLGPIFQVKRGTWFYDDGKACDESLAAQLEQGYLKIKPFRYPTPPSKTRPSTKVGDDQNSLAKSGAFGHGRSGSGDSTPRGSGEGQRSQVLMSSDEEVQKTYRLFGTYMNSVVTYQDSTIAWLSVDTIMARMSSTVYQKFAGGGYLGGVKLTRGYTEARKSSTVTTEKNPSTPTSVAVPDSSLVPGLQLDERQQKLLKRRSAPPTTNSGEDSKPTTSKDMLAEATTSLLTDNKEAEAELIRKRDESMMQNDYKDRDGEDQSRPIDHLILCTHGIGQRLGMRTESVNFIGDCNALRQTLKNVYGGSADLQALNSEIDKLPKNCRVQILPVCWRHLLDFPKKKQTRREHDLGDAENIEDEYPSLEDITIEGVPFVRSLITDLALDILLYQSAYREHIMISVLNECNRIYKLFKERHPEFDGKVHLMGHSLGSAILHDLLCRQREVPERVGVHQRQEKHRNPSENVVSKHLDFDFEVEDFYCLGSPIGLFQMLKGRTIMARHSREDASTTESPLDPDYMQDPFLASGSSTGFSNGEHLSQVTGLPLTVSSPKVAQLYNIFHPSDPIAYRLEPLIAPSMASMKPQLLPYTRNTLSASVSGIGAKVGQTFGGLWSSLSSGIASSLLNRSLGLTNDDVARMEAGSGTQSRSVSQSVGAGTNISSGGVISPPPPLNRENTHEKKKQLAEETAAADRDGGDAPTLIQDDIETLYANFQKSARSRHNEIGSDKEWQAAEEKGKKLRQDEAKVRALNRNGRVDYSIQESVLDFNPINTIASHLSYWADEDVSHFIMSQLLSRHRPGVRNSKTS